MLAEQLKAARLAAGLSQQQVAEKVGVTRMAISKYERGRMTPDGRRLIQLAHALGVPVSRLLEPRGEFTLSLVSCRWHPNEGRSRVEEAKAHELAHSGLLRLRQLEELLALETPETGRVSRLRSVVQGAGEPEEAAQRLREHWELGLGPIESVVDVFEDHGIAVVVDERSRLNASAWVADDRLVIVVSRHLPSGGECPGDRQRFSLAHEIGHVLLDPQGPAKTASERKAREGRADRFAAAFLVPRDLDEIKQKGWERSEPDPLPFEEPKRLRSLALRAWAEGLISTSRAADLAGVSVKELLYSDAEGAVGRVRA